MQVVGTQLGVEGNLQVSNLVQWVGWASERFDSRRALDFTHAEAMTTKAGRPGVRRRFGRNSPGQENMDEVSSARLSMTTKRWARTARFYLIPSRAHEAVHGSSPSPTR